MAIEVISTIKPKNNGAFPVLEAKDISVDENGTRLDEKLENLAGTTPTFDLAALGLPNVSLDGSQAFVETDTTEIMSALEKGAVRFSLNVVLGETVIPMFLIPNSIYADGMWMCTTVAEFMGKMLCTMIVQEGAIVVYFSAFSEEEAVATSIDLSAYESSGQIVETLSDGSIKTTTVEFDDNGNPIKITDSRGNETTLTW